MKRADLRMLTLVVAVAIAAFAATASYPLIWDDPFLLRYSEKVVRERGLPGLLAAEFLLDDRGAKPTGYYRPVVLLSLWGDRALSGILPQSYHLSNILLHALAVGMVFVLLRHFVSTAAAAFGSLLFGVHAAHVESVAFVSGRTDLWATLFVLVSATLWIRSRRREERGGPVVPLVTVGVTASLVLGALSKETAIALPLVLLGYDCSIAVSRGSSPLRRLWSNRAWILALACAVLIVIILRLFVAGVGLGAPAADGPRVFATSPGGVAPSLFFQSLTAYARLLIAPWPLNAYYTPDQISITPGAGAALLLLSALLVAPLPGWSDVQPPAGRALAFFWMVAFLLPATRFVPFSGAVVAERFLYLPSVGYSLLLAIWIDRLARISYRARAAARCGGALLLAAMAAGTLARERIWRDPEIFYRALSESAPDSEVGPYNLGNTYMERDATEQAIGAYQEATYRRPDHSASLLNLGLALSSLQRWPEARAAYLRVLAIQPGSVAAMTNLGLIAAMEGDFAAAMKLFREAIAADPRYARAWFNLGLAYENIGDRVEAERAYAEAIRHDPSLTKP